jgi:beta-phosphoglucomutase
MLRAIIFDFDGVLVNSEPLILRLTQQMAALEGWTITEEEYYRHYLALDDRGIVEHLYRRHGLPVNPQRCQELLAWKARAYQEAIREGLEPMPGAPEFVAAAASEFPLAIASGSLRSEVEYLLESLKLRHHFAALITADDTLHSKPDPEIFFKALAALQQATRWEEEPLAASHCLVIEDAPAGIRAAHQAGMRCLALAHSRPAAELRDADWVCRSFAEVDLATIRAGFRYE